MRRGVLAAAGAAALLLTACPEDEAATPEPDAPDEPEVEEEPEVEDEPEIEEEPAEPDELVGAQMFGIDFEGLWHFEDLTEVAVMAEPEAEVEELAADLEGEAGVSAVERVDDAALEERAELDVLQAPDEPDAAVLLLTAEDHDAATQLRDLETREDVRAVLVPTCEALAGSARHHGKDEAESQLDEAACDQPVIIEADPEAVEPWVAAAGVEQGEICIGTATAGAVMSTCSGDPADPQMPVATAAGGFVVGFAPPEVATVELDVGEQSASVEPVAVDDDAAQPYAAHLPGDEQDEELTEAPDIGDVEWRFLDADGEVVDEG